MSQTALLIVVAVFAAVGGALLALTMARRRGGAAGDKMSESARSSGAASSATHVAAAATSSAPVVEIVAEPTPPASAIRFSTGTIDIGELRPFSGEALNWPTSSDPRLSRAAESIVRGAPLTALGLQQAAGGIYHLKLTAEATAHLANGSWKFMEASGGGFRLNRVDAAGTVRGQGAMIPAQAAAGAALAVWQVLAIVTAQKFLADIDRKLASIEGGVKDLRATLEEDRRGTLLGNLGYLRQIAAALAQNVIAEEDAQTFIGQIEHIERECQQIEAASATTMIRHAGEFKTMQLTATNHFKEDVARVHRNIGDFTVAAQTRLLALRVRGVACQLRAALPVNGQTTLLRAREVSRALVEAQDAQAAYVTQLRLRRSDLRGKWTFDSTDHREQERLRRRQEELSGAFSDATEPLIEGARWIEGEVSGRLEARERPTELLVSMDNAGRVTHVRQPELGAGHRGGSIG